MAARMPAYLDSLQDCRSCHCPEGQTRSDECRDHSLEESRQRSSPSERASILKRSGNTTNDIRLRVMATALYYMPLSTMVWSGSVRIFLPKLQFCALCGISVSKVPISHEDCSGGAHFLNSAIKPAMVLDMGPVYHRTCCLLPRLGQNQFILLDDRDMVQSHYTELNP